MARMTLRLRGEDAALVLREDGTCEVMIPEGEPGALVPAHVVLLIALAQRLDDPEFCEQVIEAMKDDTWPEAVVAHSVQ